MYRLVDRLVPVLNLKYRLRVVKVEYLIGIVLYGFMVWLFTFCIVCGILVSFNVR